jgi:transposase-like protein
VSERKPRASYPDEVKATAIADSQLIGAGAAAAKYGIPLGTLTSWRCREDLQPIAVIKKDRIGQLVFSYLEANLQALTAQAYVASDPDYINRQPADGLAILHGVMSDKSIRLLEALHASEPDPREIDGD